MIGQIGTEHFLVAAGAAFVGIIGRNLQLRWANGRNGRTGCPTDIQRTHAEMLIRHDEALFGERGVLKTLGKLEQSQHRIEKALAIKDAK